MIHSNFAYTFPSITDTNKNEDWHRDYCYAIMSSSFEGGYNEQVNTMDMCANFFNGDYGGEEFKFLQQNPDGTAVPARWANYNGIKVRIMNLLGEFSAKNYNLSVRAVNKDASTRRMRQKAKKFAEMKLRPLFQELEQFSGIPLTSPDRNMIETEEELDYWITNVYKENSEHAMEACLRFLSKKFRWKNVREELFRDVLIFGRAFAKVELVNGFPEYKRVDPRNVVFDLDATNDFLDDATFFGSIGFLNIADIAEQYNFSKKEMEDLVALARGLNHGSMNSSFPQRSLAFVERYRGQLFQNTSTGLRVMCFHATWVDTEVKKFKKTTDAYGNEHFKLVDSKATGENIITKRIKIWREGIIVGGLIIKQWGVVKNSVRSTDNPSDAKAPYVCFLPNFINLKTKSVVEQIAEMQRLKDVAMYMIQLEMARSGTKGFAYDTAMLPDGWEVADVIKYLKTSGIAYFNSMANEMPNQGPGLSTIDLSMGSNVQRYVEICMLMDKEMDMISGINGARQGVLQSGKQGAAVTNTILSQSQLSTHYYFSGFDSFTERLFQLIAGLVKISWTDKEKYAPAVGDSVIDFITQDIDLDLDDYGVYISAEPVMIEDKQTYMQLVQSALQSGAVAFKDILGLMVEDDIKLGLKRLKRLTEDNEKKAQESQMQQQQMMMEQQQAGIQAQQQQAMQLAQMQSDDKLKIAQLKAEVELYKTKVESVLKQNANEIKLVK